MCTRKQLEPTRTAYGCRTRHLSLHQHGQAWGAPISHTRHAPTVQPGASAWSERGEFGGPPCHRGLAIDIRATRSKSDQSPAFSSKSQFDSCYCCRDSIFALHATLQIPNPNLGPLLSSFHLLLSAGSELVAGNLCQLKRHRSTESNHMRPMWSTMSRRSSVLAWPGFHLLPY